MAALLLALLSEPGFARDHHSRDSPNWEIITRNLELRFVHSGNEQNLASRFPILGTNDLIDNAVHSSQIHTCGLDVAEMSIGRLYSRTSLGVGRKSMAGLLARQQINAGYS